MSVSLLMSMDPNQQLPIPSSMATSIIFSIAAAASLSQLPGFFFLLASTIIYATGLSPTGGFPAGEIYPAHFSVSNTFSTRSELSITICSIGCKLALEGASLPALTSFFKVSNGIGFCLNRRIVRLFIVAS